MVVMLGGLSARACGDDAAAIGCVCARKHLRKCYSVANMHCRCYRFAWVHCECYTFGNIASVTHFNRRIGGATHISEMTVQHHAVDRLLVRHC